MDILHEKDKIVQEQATKLSSLIEENEKLNELLKTTKEKVHGTDSVNEELLRKKYENQHNLLLTDQDQDRSAYQNLLRRFNKLEQKKENLEEELQRLRRPHRAIDENSEYGRDDRLETSSMYTDDDFGYSSVRSRMSMVSEADRSLHNIDWRPDPPHIERVRILLRPFTFFPQDYCNRKSHHIFVQHF